MRDHSFPRSSLAHDEEKGAAILLYMSMVPIPHIMSPQQETDVECVCVCLFKCFLNYYIFFSL